MLGGFMTCTETCGDGVRIRMEMTLTAHSAIPLGPYLARTALSVVTLGSTTPIFVGRRTATVTIRRHVMKAAAFVFL